MARIGFIISSLFAYGGEERVVTLIANELSKYHQISIYTYENRRKEGENRNNYKLSEKIHVEEIFTERDTFFRFAVKTAYYRTGLTRGKVSGFLLKRAFYPIEMQNRWIQKIKEDKLDIVVAVSGRYTMLLGYIADRVSAKLLSWEHSSFEGYFDPRKGYYRNRMHMYAECAKKLDRCVVLNQDTAEKFRERLGIPAIVISNPKSFSSIEKADVGQKCFVTCGRVEAEKGFDDLIEAFAVFCQNRSDWKLLIIGGGSLQKKWEELAAQRGVSDRVTITGYTNEVKSYLLQGSVFVMTSRWEGFGMVVVEAFELGIPVIAYGIPAMRLLVSDGTDGRIVPAFEREKLIEAMEEFADDVSLRKRMGLKAMKKAALLNPEVIAKKWLALFEEVLEK